MPDEDSCRVSCCLSVGEPRPKVSYYLSSPYTIFLAADESVSVNPPNGTAVYVLQGGPVTFSCLVASSEGENRITDWRIDNINVINEFGAERVNFTGSELLTVPLGSITTARNVITILNNFNDFTLTCQVGGVVYAQYYVFLYSKSTIV